MPVLVIGPQADIGRGLAMTELVVVLDCTPSADEVLAFGVEWSKAFKLRMIVTASPAPGTNFAPSDLQQYLDQRVEGLTAPGGVGTELMRGQPDGEADAVSELLAERDSSVALISANHGKAGGLGIFAVEAGAPGAPTRPGAPRLIRPSRPRRGVVGQARRGVGGRRRRCGPAGPAGPGRGSGCADRRGRVRSMPMASMRPDTLTPKSVETSCQVAWASSDR